MGEVEEIKKKGSFCHLHVHSHYSKLQATSSINRLIKKAKEDKMPALAITDLGNMYGAFEFVQKALDNLIKPIVGCELIVSEECKKLKFTSNNSDERYNQVLLAKSEIGYHNLAKLCSFSFSEGLYDKCPHIDKKLIVQYKNGLIATTGSLHSEIPYLILNASERQAEEAFQWWLSVFGEDFYIELNRHRLAEEDHVNEVLLRFAKKYNVKYFAANEVFYLDKEEANAHDVLLCIKEGELKSTPIGYGEGKRYGLPNDEFYFKPQEEMKSIFRDLPEAIDTIQEVIEKIETYKLERNVSPPKFNIPKEFETEDNYLRHLTYEGVNKKYGEISNSLKERIDFELETIKKIGYPGYFLIVQDFTSKARELGVSVGPGRGSTAGSVVAYCIGITSVDPVKYDLLFERFLNPDCVSLPDIDIDFDDEGRDKMLKYVIEKYGSMQVSEIITYGFMSARSAIRDCGRVMELPLIEVKNLTKLLPERPGALLTESIGKNEELRNLINGADKRADVLKCAVLLNDSLRNTGTHACGFIIAPENIANLVPVSKVKDSEMLVTQFDNSVVEKAGLLKIDFLGLTTLTIIKTALTNIKKRYNIEIDIDNIPRDDFRTYQLYQIGDTTNTFQFDGERIQDCLREFKPDKFEDLIALYALFRPYTMKYFTSLIERKHGRESVKYDLPVMEEYLKETYGITIYQEQIMLLSQKLANFSKSESDVLRKALNKKEMGALLKMRRKFYKGCMKNGYKKILCHKIWKDWEEVGPYAFNKSHATCYALIAFQSVYLKANYLPEYLDAIAKHKKQFV